MRVEGSRRFPALRHGEASLKAGETLREGSEELAGKVSLLGL